MPTTKNSATAHDTPGNASLSAGARPDSTATSDITAAARAPSPILPARFRRRLIRAASCSRSITPDNSARGLIDRSSRNAHQATAIAAATVMKKPVARLVGVT